MTIKGKLIANMMVTAVIIAGIALASYSSMHFLQERLSDIAEKSTPFQIATVEFQRELQSCITSLITVNSALNVEDYTLFRAEAERSLERVKRVQQNLVSLNTGNRVNATDELDRISSELFAAVEARITSDNAARSTNAKVLQQMNDSSAMLGSLNGRIRTLQEKHAAQFGQVLKNNEKLSAQLRDLEAVRDLVNDLLSASQAAATVRTVPAFRVARGRINTILWRIAAINISAIHTSSNLKTLAADTNEFVSLQGAAVSGRDHDSIRWASEALNSLTESMNSINLELKQELELRSSELAIETGRQGDIFSRSNSANSILLADSGLITLGFTITGEINRLFTVTTPAELDALGASIHPLFDSLAERADRVEKALAAFNAGDEVKMLHAAMATYDSIRSELQSAHGIIATLKRKAEAADRAASAAEQLRTLISRQTTLGNERVSVAQSLQKRSIAAVNDMIRRSMSRITGIGMLAVLIGILISLWIYRSVLGPLRMTLAAVSSQQGQAEEKAQLARAIAEGDLDQEVTVGDVLKFDSALMNNDEMGRLLNAVTEMSATQVSFDRAFADMAASLRSNRSEEYRRARLKNGLVELNMILRDEQNTARLAERTLSYMAGFLCAEAGIMYRFDAACETLHPIASYALAGTGREQEVVRLGEGLAGQVARERRSITLTSVPPGYLTITSALGEAEPLNVSIFPLLHNETLTGVMELGSFGTFSADDSDFIHQASEGIAIALHIHHSRQLVNNLLEQTRLQAEELQQTNEELEERTQAQAEQQRAQRASVTRS